MQIDLPESAKWMLSGKAETGRTVVYPWLCDAMGHLATQHYMRFYDDAFFHFLGLLTGYRIQPELGWADVKHEVRYVHELRAGDLIILRSVVLHVGNTSVGHRTTMTRASDAKLCSWVDATTVRFDLRHRKAIPIELGVRATAEALMLSPDMAGALGT